MDTASIVTIIEKLNGSRVRYLVVGGLAVVAHGYVRFTADMDLVLDFAPDNLRRAVQALSDLGYKPRAPVPIEQFADEDIRRDWVDQKGLTVFSLWSAEHPMTEIDLFTEDPFESFSASQCQRHHPNGSSHNNYENPQSATPVSDTTRTDHEQVKANNRHEKQAARRTAIVEVSSFYDLLNWKGDVSTNYTAQTGTN